MPTVSVACRERNCPNPALGGGWCEFHQPVPWATGTTPMPPGWKARRKMVLERDGYACRTCRKPATEVHHIKGRAEGGDEDMDNLVSLCEGCHRRETGRQRALKKRSRLVN